MINTASKNRISSLLSRTGRTLFTSTAMTAVGLLSMTGNAQAGNDWTDHVVTGGGGSISIDTATPSTTNITQTGHRVKVSGDGDIKAGWTVNVHQDTSSSQYILFDTEADPTHIRGNLNANGEIYIFDRNGVIFGADSHVNVGSIVASSGELSSTDAELDAGKLIINLDDADGNVINKGTITVADAGIAAFVAPTIKNSGVIKAKMGHVIMASGEVVTLDMHGDGLVEVAVSGELADSLIRNSGEISAKGGEVIITASAAKGAVDNIINMDGIIDVSSATVKGGKIVLSGGSKGTVKVKGKLKANGKSGTDAGSIDVTGQNILLTGSSRLKANSDGANAGDIKVLADGTLTINGDISAQGLAGTGDIETSAPNTIFGGGASILATREWLLDPTNVVVDNPLALLIEGQLAVGDMTVQTPAGGLDKGTIHLDTVVNWVTGNTFSLLADDDIIVNAGGGILALGGGNFVAVSGDDFRMQTNNNGIITNGGDVSITAENEFSLNDGFILASGGNILIDNGDSFFATANSLATSGTGTIEINQNKNGDDDTYNGEPTIQAAIDAIVNTGTGTNTVNVGAGTWVENLSADVANLKLAGADGAILQAATTDDLIVVTASNVNIDPFVLDGLGGSKYGVYADGAGADGLVVDGNTFRNFKRGGIYIAHSGDSTGSIINNTFEGSSTSGLRTGTLNGGYTLDITNNIIGTDGDEVQNGLLFGRVRNATVNISGGSIDSAGGTGTYGGDGINFTRGLFNGAEVNISDIEVTSGNAEAVDFHQAVRSNTVANITSGTFIGGGHGVEFDAISGEVNIGGFSGASITGQGADKNGINLLASITGNLSVTNTGVTGDADAIGSDTDQDNTVDGGTVKVIGSFLTGTNGDGLELGVVTNGAEVTVTGGFIDAGDNGIHFVGGVSDSIVNITDSAGITAGDDGIDFNDEISGKTVVTIARNNIGRSDAKVGDDGIDIERITDGATVNIIDNPNIYADENGIEISGSVDNGATVNISGNNHGIHAGDHGIYFGGAIYAGADIDIHGNIISADEDDNGTGDGIHFADAIYRSTINIGDGGSRFQSGASNIIRGNNDGIHFDDTITSEADIAIDGNRIGYFAWNVGDTLYSFAGGDMRVGDDGIQFVGDIRGDATITITDNFIRSEDDGISFIGDIRSNADVLIGGRQGNNPDGNTIDANDDGIQFQGDIFGRSLLAITHNDVEAGEDGVSFSGDTSNTVDFGSHTSEILIAENSIVGGENGILFTGEASGEGHDIEISDNELIEGQDGDGIRHTGNINDAELWITGNDEIAGEYDGIHLEGYFYNDAKILIDNNGQGRRKEGVSGNRGDGIEIWDYIAGNADVDVTNNHVHWSGDNGIEITDVDSVYIAGNTIHDVDGNGIYVDSSDNIQIVDNDIHDVGDDGIRVDDGRYASITGNHIGNTGDDGIDVNNNYRVKIIDNDIHDTGLESKHGDGISVDESNRAEIKKNDITGAGRDGINVKDSNNVLIGWNDIFAQGGNYYKRDYGTQGAGRDGIHVENGDDLLIIGNDVTADLGWDHYRYGRNYGGSIDNLGAGRHGIYVEGGKNIAVKFNDVEGDSRGYGRHKKTVDSVGEDGIHITGAEDILIGWNDVSRAGDDGIQVVVGNVEAKDKRKDDKRRSTSIRGFGRHYDDTNEVTIIGNNVDRSGDDGIVVNTEESKRFRPSKKKVLSKKSERNELDGKKLSIKIAHNDVLFSGDDGIEVNIKTPTADNDYYPETKSVSRGSRFGFDKPDNSIQILNNNVAFSGDDGIVVKIAPEKIDRRDDTRPVRAAVKSVARDMRGGDDNTINNFIRIDDNNVAFSGDDGIQVDVKTAGSSSREVYPDLVLATEKSMGYAPRFGSRGNKNTIIITDNNVAFSGDDGIDVSVGTQSNDDHYDTMSASREYYSEMDSVVTSNFIKIDDNNVFHSHDDGITVKVDNPTTGSMYPVPETRISKDDAYPVKMLNRDSTNRIIISNNNVKDSYDDGIQVIGEQGSNVELLVDTNHVEDSGDNGILIVAKGGQVMAGSDLDLEDEIEVSLTKTKVSAYPYPMSREGAFNSVVVDNIVENSDASGLNVAGSGHDNVEVSGNTFTDNDIGASFESGRIDLTGEGNNFNGGRIGMRFAPAEIEPYYDDFYKIKSLSISEVKPDPVFAEMSLVDDTIGEQTFDGQSSFFVELDNGAFFNPGTPTKLNANDSIFVGTPFGTFTPSVDYPEGLPLGPLAYLEGKFFDYRDDGSLGLFFFKPAASISQKDIFQYFGANAGSLGGLRVTIAGMPSVPGAPAALNNIAPAAGGSTNPEDLNNIETSAGGEETDPENLNDIETAAGGEEASCWGDALNSAGSGQATTLSYGGSAEDLLNGEASCGS